MLPCYVFIRASSCTMRPSRNMRHPIILVLLASLTKVYAQTGSNNGSADDHDNLGCSINVPGFFHRGNCHLLCRPTTWINILVFYLGNYGAHAVTITTQPGQSIYDTLLAIAHAIVFPGTGTLRGLRKIRSFARFGATPLEVAARAHAIYTVIPSQKEEGPTVAPAQKLRNGPDDRAGTQSSNEKCHTQPKQQASDIGNWEDKSSRMSYGFKSHLFDGTKLPVLTFGLQSSLHSLHKVFMVAVVCRKDTNWCLYLQVRGSSEIMTTRILQRNDLGPVL